VIIVIFSGIGSSDLNSLMMPQTAVLALLFLGEGLTAKAIAGLALVGIGTIVVQLRGKTTK
jgi:uncharacterized membrane protein